MFLAGCASEDGIYHPGSYTASAAGYAGDVMVEVEFDSEKILSVTILEHNETPTVADKAIEEIPDQIVEQQTSEVDVVTSATLTSEAIKTAVEGGKVGISAGSCHPGDDRKLNRFSCRFYLDAVHGCALGF